MRLSLLATLVSDMRIQAIRLRLPIGTNGSFPDLGLREALMGRDTPFDEELPPMDSSGKKLKVWMIRDSFRCGYILSIGPEEEQVWLIGPYLTEELSLTEISRRYEKIGLKDADLQFLSQYYRMLPRIRDENLFYTIVHHHCAEDYGAGGFEIAYWEMSFLHVPKRVMQERVRTEYHRDMIEYVYSQERLMMDCIARSNYSGAMAAIHRLERKGADSRTSSTIRDMKNYSIVLNTLCRIAAREGGAHPWDIDQYSRDISIQLENAASVRELTAIREPMLREYCALVGAMRKKEYSPAVQQVMNLVDAGFSEHITLQGAAEEVSLSANYLSLRFRQETGKTFSEYLTDVRMERARQMLAGTDLPVTVVAAECGIPDNNYFSRLFRRVENLSPREYRMKHRGK